MNGIYLDEEALDIFEKILSRFSKASLFILTPDKPNTIKTKIERVPRFKMIDVHILFAPHSEVHKYLSAADIAFATIKPTPNRKYCSAIKVGEYWANGLPVVITPGIGDDSSIIEHEGGGVVYSIGNPELAIEKIFQIANNGRTNNNKTIASLALKYRSLSIVENVYKNILQRVIKI